MPDRRVYRPLPADLAGLRATLEQVLRLLDEYLSPILVGKGSPETVVKAKVGFIYLRLDGGALTSFYVKESGDNTKTGWVAK